MRDIIDEASARAEIKRLVEAGELHASTGPEVYGDWSEESKLKFKEALAEMFGWKNNDGTK